MDGQTPLPTRSTFHTTLLQQPPQGECCPICYTPYTTSATSTVQLPCTHTFCHACITQWLSTSSTCPLCRRALFVEDEGEEEEEELSSDDDTPEEDLVVLGSGDEDAVEMTEDELWALMGIIDGSSVVVGEEERAALVGIFGGAAMAATLAWAAAREEQQEDDGRHDGVDDSNGGAVVAGGIGADGAIRGWEGCGRLRGG
ncbi:hypothetical protein BU24DRAFT_207244 [Aaosphaeria arxii CBS 175.79]|uniref:RING-type domain-containing protein n=1 Tax=Aaosphaeria arxii CBS 175.79 TaxID=1450172 RepID=A0A6A5XUN5_9PLEO|nr:uncharacterized protein BU24DRAFT_207244 [Aaosphaeria arxii CBS 175.79]KAF2016636.1 hypothetical protein BU24DRAFT_207244 [Aaosphaeria arxii CBS 175.79]